MLELVGTAGIGAVGTGGRVRRIGRIVWSGASETTRRRMAWRSKTWRCRSVGRGCFCRNARHPCHLRLNVRFVREPVGHNDILCRLPVALPILAGDDDIQW